MTVYVSLLCPWCQHRNPVRVHVKDQTILAIQYSNETLEVTAAAAGLGTSSTNTAELPAVWAVHQWKRYVRRMLLKRRWSWLGQQLDYLKHRYDDDAKTAARMQSIIDSGKCADRVRC